MSRGASSPNSLLDTEGKLATLHLGSREDFLYDSIGGGAAVQTHGVRNVHGSDAAATAPYGANGGADSSEQQVDDGIWKKEGFATFEDLYNSAVPVSGDAFYVPPVNAGHADAGGVGALHESPPIHRHGVAANVYEGITAPKPPYARLDQDVLFESFEPSLGAGEQPLGGHELREQSNEVPRGLPAYMQHSPSFEDMHKASSGERSAEFAGRDLDESLGVRIPTGFPPPQPQSSSLPSWSGQNDPSAGVVDSSFQDAHDLIHALMQTTKSSYAKPLGATDTEQPPQPSSNRVRSGSDSVATLSSRRNASLDIAIDHGDAADEDPNKRSVSVSATTRNDIINAYMTGATLKSISEEQGINYRTIQSIIRRYKKKSALPELASIQADSPKSPKRSPKQSPRGSPRSPRSPRVGVQKTRFPLNKTRRTLSDPNIKLVSRSPQAKVQSTRTNDPSVPVTEGAPQRMISHPPTLLSQRSLGELPSVQQHRGKELMGGATHGDDTHLGAFDMDAYPEELGVLTAYSQPQLEPARSPSDLPYGSSGNDTLAASDMPADMWSSAGALNWLDSPEFNRHGD